MRGIASAGSGALETVLALRQERPNPHGTFRRIPRGIPQHDFFSGGSLEVTQQLGLDGGSGAQGAVSAANSVWWGAYLK